MKKAKSIVIVTACTLMLFLPLVLLETSGEATHRFFGEKSHQRPAFTLETFFNGQYQVDFERWFSTKYPMRPNIVEFYSLFDVKKDEIRFLAFDNDRDVPPAKIPVSAKFPEYALREPVGVDPKGYKGTAQVVIGKNGYLYENGYINEYMGYSAKYTEVKDEDMLGRVAVLKDIQRLLEERDIAFCVVITPSKASSMPEFIPEWYTSKYTSAQDYTRPYLRFVAMLEDEKVHFVDSARLYQSLGLVNTFPKTGTHWTKPAAYETTEAVIEEYERQTGRDVRHLRADVILNSKNPPQFGNSEMDIFSIAYAAKEDELRKAIVDERYYWPDVYVENADKPVIPHITLQGGSFSIELLIYFRDYGITKDITWLRYNNEGNTDIWEDELAKTHFVLLEVNEQFIYGMGGDAPGWGNADFLVSESGSNIIDALYDYLRE